MAGFKHAKACSEAPPWGHERVTGVSWLHWEGPPTVLRRGASCGSKERDLLWFQREGLLWFHREGPPMVPKRRTSYGSKERDLLLFQRERPPMVPIKAKVQDFVKASDALHQRTCVQTFGISSIAGSVTEERKWTHPIHSTVWDMGSLVIQFFLHQFNHFPLKIHFSHTLWFCPYFIITLFLTIPNRRHFCLHISIYGIYIAPLQSNYSEALPAQARTKISGFRSATYPLTVHCS